jgi:hypothetical protein
MSVFSKAAAVVMLAATCFCSVGPFGATLAWAAACEEAHDPSPSSDAATGINFHNETPYAFRVFWIDFDGFLKEYGLVQPGETASFNTFIGHKWMVELYASEERTECFGPVVSRDNESCEARILWDDGIGIDAGFCDF